MCGLVGYIGNSLSRTHIIKGLSRLEYRGYDSAGFACLNPADNHILYSKAQGHLKNLIKNFEEKPIDGHIGLGHTRWSSHGVASTENAHPHFDCQKKISVAHNGIIENYHELREMLRNSGHTFISQTDTEVVAHLFETLLQENPSSLYTALLKLTTLLKGAYALIFISELFPNQMVVVRKGSPLCLGIGTNEIFVSSDSLAFAENTNNAIFLPDQSFAILNKGSLELYDFLGTQLEPKIQQINAYWSTIDKMGYKHYMLKEIFEQKSAIRSTLEKLRSIEDIWQQIGISQDTCKDLESITLIGCGTSWYAARIAQFYFEQLCGIPAKILLGSEFRYMHFFPEKNSLYIAISQSGETADTLEAIRLINSSNLPTIGLTNVGSSTLVREARGSLLMNAGPEIAVASTKAFSCQLVSLFWLANLVAFQKGRISLYELDQAYEDLLLASEALENTIATYQETVSSTLASFYAQFKKFIFLGRNISYPFAMEAALKLKEIAYVFAQCYPAGELKHGPIALIDKETPILIFSTLDNLIYQKLVSNAQEVKAREGHLTIFAFEGQQELIELADIIFIIPKVNPLLAPLAMTGLMQFLMYNIADYLGCPIDKPRNLAKSVTIE